MKIDIAICTWNRRRQLQRTLARLREVQVPEGHQVRLLVVNNNSHDGTEQMFADYDSPFPLRLIHELQQGHIYARNAAVAAADGELMLWIDDDVCVGPEWLGSYIQAAARQPDNSFWGGPISVQFDDSPPAWIDANWDLLRGCFAQRDLGETELPLADDRLPYGANFAIRTEVQKRFVYTPGFGRSSRLVLGGDEIRLFQTLLEHGYRGRWVPQAKVDHIIDRHRTNSRYIHRYFVGQGIALIRSNQGWGRSIHELRAESDHELFWYRLKRFLRPSQEWLSHLIRGSLAHGQWLALSEGNRLTDN